MLLKLLVEGQTEQTFVKEILKPHLEMCGYRVSPVINLTSQGHHGGLSHYQQFKRNLRKNRTDAPNCLLTTMIDLYGLPSDFPGMSECNSFTDPQKKVTFLEMKLKEDMRDDNNFIPYIQLHEFEALLFSDIRIIDQVVSRTQSPSPLPRLQRVLDQYGSPENIDHNKGPSCHLQEICERDKFPKLTWGIEIAKMIGLETMRGCCPHFNQWLTQLETQSPTPPTGQNIY